MAGKKIRTVTLGVMSIAEVRAGFLAAARGDKRAYGNFISFASPELMWKVLTAKRWEILQAMAGKGPLTIREIAGLVDRGLKEVHSDVRALTLGGILNKTKDGTEFPYDEIHVDFTLRALPHRSAADLPSQDLVGASSEFGL
jgi:predicted transcriptional regulator